MPKSKSQKTMQKPTGTPALIEPKIYYNKYLLFYCKKCPGKMYTRAQKCKSKNQPSVGRHVEEEHPGLEVADVLVKWGHKFFYRDKTDAKYSFEEQARGIDHVAGTYRRASKEVSKLAKGDMKAKEDVSRKVVDDGAQPRLEGDDEKATSLASQHGPDMTGEEYQGRCLQGPILANKDAATGYMPSTALYAPATSTFEFTASPYTHCDADFAAELERRIAFEVSSAFAVAPYDDFPTQAQMSNGQNDFIYARSLDTAPAEHSPVLDPRLFETVEGGS